jgi:ribonuclease E
MVDKKEDTKKVRIKATTGAWWKSTTKQEDGAPATATEKNQPEEKAGEGKKAVAPKQQKARRGGGRDNAAAKAQEKGGEKVVEKKRPAQRKRKSPRAKPKAATVEAAESLEPPEKSPEVPENAARGAEPAQTKEAGKQAAKGQQKSGRGRRKRSSRASQAKKESPAQEPEVAVEEETLEEESTEDDVLEERDEEELPGKADRKDAAREPVETKKVCKLLINAEEPEECRLALLEDGKLQSLHVSTIAKTQTKNNIYKARIVAIEPSLQAAFVDYGTEKNGFLPFGEIHPEYYKQNLTKEVREIVDSQQWKKLKISDVMERGQDILVQVVKEEIGKKGANMTTYLSLPGRCVVLMPGSDSAGISRKISGEQRRAQLRDIMKSLELPEGLGWIVRTASVDITEETLSKDVEYLLKLWEDIRAKGQKIEGAGLVYEDDSSVSRFLREHFDPSFEEILVDDREALEQVKSFVAMLPEDQRTVKVRLHQGARPIFNQYSVEDQIESIYQPQVNLPSGGSIVINPTEALVAIDVNSGSTSKGKNFEASIFQANMEAATELARQLRLRDLGGLIVVDFIDMRAKKNIIAVEKQVKAAMKRDKAKVDFTRISKFGLMQISRQKLGAPVESANYQRCEHCKGRGTVRSIETLSLFYLRRIQTGASRKPVERVECHLPIDVASYLLNNKRAELADMEKRYNVEITIVPDTDMKPADNNIIFHKAEKEAGPKKQA